MNEEKRSSLLYPVFTSFLLGSNFGKSSFLEVDGYIIVTPELPSTVNETWLEQKFSTVTKVMGFVAASLSYSKLCKYLK